MSDLAKEIHSFLMEETGMAEEEFGYDTKLFSDGFIDSFTMTAVLAFLEEEAGVQIPQSEIKLENFDTINNMVNFVANNAS